MGGCIGYTECFGISGTNFRNYGDIRDQVVGITRCYSYTKCGHDALFHRSYNFGKHPSILSKIAKSALESILIEYIFTYFAGISNFCWKSGTACSTFHAGYLGTVNTWNPYIDTGRLHVIYLPI